MPSNRQIRRRIENTAAPSGGRGGNRGKIVAFAVTAVLLLVGVPFALAQMAGRAEQPAPVAETTAPAAQPTPSPQDDETDGSAAAIPAFEPPQVDATSPESVARGWAYVYHSRDAEDDYQRLDSADGYIPEEMRQELVGRATSGDSPLAGLGATHLEGVQFSDSTTQSTPIRWAKNAKVTVQTEAGPTVAIDYELQVDATDGGWMLTRATERGWAQVK